MPSPAPASAASSGNNNRIGLALVGVVLCFYAFGLVQTAWHLPAPHHRPRAWLGRLGAGRHLTVGGNIHLSKNGISDAGDADDDAGARADADADADADDEEGGDGDGGPIPPARWPVSIRDEDGNMEEVYHPGHRAKGHPDVAMLVPRFWVDDPVAVHQNTLMSRELAMKIGSCRAPDAHGNQARGDGCPLKDRTVFVAIASYRDWQVRLPPRQRRPLRELCRAPSDTQRCDPVRSAATP